MEKELPRLDFLRTENYKAKDRDEINVYLKQYVTFCMKKRYKLGTTLSVLRYYLDMKNSRYRSRNFNFYTKTDIQKRIEFIGKSFFYDKTHGELKSVIFESNSSQAKKIDKQNFRKKKYVTPEKIIKFVLDGSCR